MRVYRVEHRDGLHGPYQGRGNGEDAHTRLLSQGLGCYDCAQKGRPAPPDDGMGYDNRARGETRYAFKSQAVAYKWFTARDRRILASEGFVLRAFEVEYGVESGYSGQVRYPLRSSSRLPEKLDLVRPFEARHTDRPEVKRYPAHEGQRYDVEFNRMMGYDEEEG